MQSIGVFIRSKIPVLYNSNENEQTVLLNNLSRVVSNKVNYYTNKEHKEQQPTTNNELSFDSQKDEGFNVFEEPRQIDSINQEFTLPHDYIENDLYEYNDKSVGNRINEWQAGWNVTNAIQGMFVVSLPYTIAIGGYWSLIAMLLVAYVCCYTGKILIDCLYDDDDDEFTDLFNNNNNPKLLPAIKISTSKRRHRIRFSYVDIAKEVWGSQVGARIVSLAQNIELLMTCILYLVLCGDLFVGSFPNSGLDHTSWTIISCMILIPCAFIRSLKFISSLSFCNAVVHLIINLIIIIYCISKFNAWDFKKVEFKINVWSFPIALGIIVFSYTSQIFLPTLEGSMVERKKFNSMLNVSHLAAALFKSLFGYIAFLTWQEDTKEIITNNLPTRNFKILVNLILVVKALLSYPLPYYASVELLESSLFIASEPIENVETMERKRKKKESLSSSVSTKPVFMLSCYNSDGDFKFWAICLRIGLILITLFLAIFIPHFAILMGLIGSVTGTMLSLIWPCYFHLHLKRKSLRWYQIGVDLVIIVFGVLITVTGVYYSGYALIKALRNEDTLNFYKSNKFFSLNAHSNKTVLANGLMSPEIPFNKSRPFFPNLV